MTKSRRMADVRPEAVRGRCAINGIPYVPRDCEPEVERRLRRRRVLIVGASMAGKTRLALQVARTTFPEQRFVDPEDGRALRDLLERAPEAELVIWLDDLERFLDGSWLTWEVLDRLHTQGHVLVATIRRAVFYDMVSDFKVHPNGMGIAKWFGEAVQLSDWSEDELHRATERGVRDEALVQARRYGLSAYVAGGPVLLRRFRSGRNRQPNGYALVRAAADWARAGMSCPIPETTLTGLVPAYATGHGLTVDAGAVREGLTWATRPGRDSVALLDHTPDGFIVLDYVLDHLAGRKAPVPEEMWDAVLAHASPSELVAVGYEAAWEHQRLDIAETAYHLAMDSGDRDAAPAAAINFGSMCQRRDDLDGAAAAFRQAIGSGHADHAPMAAFQLGNLRCLRKRLDLDGAVAAYQLAIDSGHHDAAPRSAEYLGNLSKRRGDPEKAAIAYQIAIDSGHPHSAWSAACELGVQCLEGGELDRAVAYFQFAIDTDYYLARMAVGDTLCALRHVLADLHGAIEADRLAADPADSDGVLTATVDRSVAQHEPGDAATSAAALQGLIDSAHPDAAPNAAIDVGILRKAAGDFNGATAAFNVAIASAHPEAAPKAAYNLGNLFLEDGDIDGATAAYQTAIDSGHVQAAPTAAFRLGFLRQEQGDVDGAAAAFEVVTGSSHADAAVIASVNLGILRQSRGDLEGAAQAYQLAIWCGRREMVGRAVRRMYDPDTGMYPMSLPDPP